MVVFFKEQCRHFSVQKKTCSRTFRNVVNAWSNSRKSTEKWWREWVGQTGTFILHQTSFWLIETLSLLSPLSLSHPYTHSFSLSLYLSLSVSSISIIPMVWWKVNSYNSTWFLDTWNYLQHFAFHLVQRPGSYLWHKNVCKKGNWSWILLIFWVRVRYYFADLEKVRNCPQSDFLEMKMSTLISKNVHSFWRVRTFILYKEACFKIFVDIFKRNNWIRDILA